MRWLQLTCHPLPHRIGRDADTPADPDLCKLAPLQHPAHGARGYAQPFGGFGDGPEQSVVHGVHDCLRVRR